MYGNNYGYYNQQRSIGVPTQPINNQFLQSQQYSQQPVITTPMSVPNGLQGKIVDNIDIVKVTEIPYDGSTSYFPLTDGSAIVTKKLGMNGTGEIVIYKPVIEEKSQEKNKVNYITEDYLNEKINKLDNSEILASLLDELKSLKEEIKEVQFKSKSKEK